ncbi:hypothetical protein OWC43_22530 [Methylorubrum sp. POS3]
MSIGRLTRLAVFGFVLTCGPSWAQEPAGGEASSWTDPPARTAPSEPARTSAPSPEPPRSEPRQAEQRQTAPVRANPVPSKADPAMSERATPPAEPTAAELRQDAIRRAVARSTAQREAEAAARDARAARVARRSVVERAEPKRRSAEPSQRFSDRLAPRPYERRTSFARSMRRPVYGYADPVPYDPGYGRSEGRAAMRPSPIWQGEGEFDDRARRLAQARSAGYLVMRSRSYAYPDGTVVRRLAPIDGDDFDD